MAVRSKSLQAALAVGVTVMAGCDSSSSTKPAEARAAPQVLLSAQVLATTRANLHDVTDRLLPAIGDIRAESEIRVQIAEFDARLALGDARGAESALVSAKASIAELSERTSSGGRETPDVTAIHLAIDEAESALSLLKGMQTKAAQ